MTGAWLRRVGLTFAGLLVATQTASAQQILDIRDFRMDLGFQITGGFVGVGAREMGMGGAALAGVSDGSALYWNPAALTRVRRMELLAGLSRAGSSPTTTMGLAHPVDASASAAFTRLNAAVITAPYPAYRGGLTFAIGYDRPGDYTYRSEQRGPFSRNGADYDQVDDVRQEGGLSQLSIGFGVEISQQVAVGLSSTWYRGDLSVRRELTLAPTDGGGQLYGVFRQNSDISGYMVTAGTTAQLPHGLVLGLAATPPVTYTVDGTFGDAYNDFPEEEEGQYRYKVEGPWVLGTGLAWTTYALTIATDIWFVDWSQATFKESPFAAGSEASPGTPNADTYFRDYYDSPIRWHVGLEALLPWIATVARVGYYSNPDPFAGPVLSTGEAVTYTERAGYFTAGLGWLIDDTVTVDLAYTTGGDEYRAGTLTETRNSDSAFLTVGFRL